MDTSWRGAAQLSVWGMTKGALDDALAILDQAGTGIKERFRSQF